LECCQQQNGRDSAPALVDAGAPSRYALVRCGMRGLRPCPGHGCHGRLVVCGDVCADTQNDLRYCGGCDGGVRDGYLCSDGGLVQCGASDQPVCAPQVADGGYRNGCMQGLHVCEGRCSDLSHSSNCGACGNVCVAGQSCVNSRCVCRGVKFSPLAMVLLPLVSPAGVPGNLCVIPVLFVRMLASSPSTAGASPWMLRRPWMLRPPWMPPHSTLRRKMLLSAMSV
jgi:hypothetical protein